VERAGNRILVGSDAHLGRLDFSIPGAYYREAQEIWSVPLDLTTCHLLRERFGNRLVIGPSLTHWARAEKRTREIAEAIAAAPDAPLTRLPEVAPKLFAAMESRKYQRSGVRFIADAKGRDGRLRALLADTVGLGKSAEALGAILEAGLTGPFLIVCPKTAVKSTWEAEIRRWLPEDHITLLPEGRAQRDNILNSLLLQSRAQVARGFHPDLELTRNWVVVNPYVVRTQTWFVCGECGDKTKYKAGPVDELDCGHLKERGTKTEHDHTFPQLFEIPWGAIAVDESDQILIRLTGTPNLQRRGMELLRDSVRPGGMRLAMSGTPFRSKPHQMWSTLNWLDPVRWSGKWRWVQNYWRTGGYGGYEVSSEGFIEEREPLLIDELKDVMIRRTRDEVRGDLPAKLYPSNVDPETSGLTPGIYVDLSAKQLKAYQSMAKMGVADLVGGELNPVGVLAEMTRLKQFANSEGKIIGGEYHPIAAGGKYDWIVEFLLSLGFPDRPSTKVVIASQFTKLLNAFAEGVSKEFRGKIGQGSITGGSSGAVRAATIGRFEDLEDPLSVLWINTKAGGSSITLDAAEVMIILDETYVADEQEQLEGRIDNRQPERRIVPRSYYYLRSLGTVEEHIAAANAAAKARGERLLNGAAIARRAREFIK
jgi:hypothetical protein